MEMCKKGEQLLNFNFHVVNEVKKRSQWLTFSFFLCAHIYVTKSMMINICMTVSTLNIISLRAFLHLLEK